MRPILLLLSLAACVSEDEMLAALDRDGDGAYDPAAAELGEAGPFDCDDDDDQIGPGTAEACNGLDDDCDGQTDEAGATGEQTFYADADEDGYGDPDKAVTACEQPADRVVEAGDCDDLAAAVHPDVPDPCDGIDNDCDGPIDEDKPSWYLDADKDGYGDPDQLVENCTAPVGYLADDQDCDDADASISPEGVEECDGGVDNDCDGKIDAADDSNVGDATWYADVDEDGYGDPATGIAQCSKPSGHVRNDDDCDDGSAAVRPEADETCEDGIDQDCDARDVGCGVYGADALADASASFVSGTSGYFALGLATGGDLDGDGFDEIAITEPDAASMAGRTWIVYGGMAPLSGDYEMSDVADAWYDGPAAYDLAGGGVAFPGDLDGDGHEDLALGAVEMDGASPGSVYLVYGDGSRESGAVSLAGAPRLAGAAAGDATGRPLAPAGDFDGDGRADLLVGAPEAAGTPGGRVYLLPGRTTRYSSANLEDFADVWLAETGVDPYGESLAGGFDVDGDGLDDTITGSPHGDSGLPHGRAYVVLGGTSTGTTVISDVADLILEAETSGYMAAGAGDAVALGPDYDGDGLADIAVGAPYEDSNHGVAYVVRGAAALAGTTDLGTAAYIRITGASAGDAFGGATSLVGDVDGDGKSDLAVGAPGASTSDGAAYVFLGGLAGTADALDAEAVRTGTADQAAGAVLPSAPGDVNGDGFDDLLVGGNTFGTTTGAAWLLYGGPR